MRWGGRREIEEERIDEILEQLKTEPCDLVLCR